VGWDYVFELSSSCAPKFLITEPEPPTLDCQRGDYHEETGESSRDVDLSLSAHHAKHTVCNFVEHTRALVENEPDQDDELDLVDGLGFRV
jgi:hypothetical protein